MLFSIGNLKPLFEKTFPACWEDHEICNKQWLNAIDYLEIVGIIVGQILVGFVGDWYVVSYTRLWISQANSLSGLVGDGV